MTRYLHRTISTGIALGLTLFSVGSMLVFGTHPNWFATGFSLLVVQGLIELTILSYLPSRLQARGRARLRRTQRRFHARQRTEGPAVWSMPQTTGSRPKIELAA
jgi:hypothetical protein